jgi:cytochrome c oxidase cbb3-type subunit III
MQRQSLVLRGIVLAFAVQLCAQVPEQHRSAATAADPSAIGRSLYNSNCAGCHGLDGKGGEHGPNIATNPDVQHLQDQDVQRTVREGIPAAGMPAFGSKFNPDQIAALVDHVRALQGHHKQVPVTGDPEKGKVLFYGKAKCSECHMLAGKGGFLGSDLSSYGASHSASEIREAILNPNKGLDPRNGIVTVTTRHNQTYSGLLRNEDNFSVQLQTPDGIFHFFDRSALSHVEYTGRSMMPSDYGVKLRPAELDDLTAYLLTSASQQTANQPKENADH